MSSLRNNKNKEAFQRFFNIQEQQQSDILDNTDRQLS
jgi:hypothetical protein